MKLSAVQVERFLRKPDPNLAAALVFGPDQGLVRERALALIGTVLDQPDDPFRLSDLPADLLRAEPARLSDEARALTLSGGRRVVVVRQASDAVSAACERMLKSVGGDALVVVEAAELAPSSSLRRLFERASNAVAIPCYHDQGRDLAGLIDQVMAEHGLEPEGDARQYLVDHLGADRGVTRAELAKLMLYLGDASTNRPARRGRVTLEQVAAVVGDTAALGLDDLVDAASVGHTSQLERCLDRLLGEGQAPVRIVRALANHLVRLQRLALEVERGERPDRLVEQARPPFHFRRRDKVRRALHRWTVADSDRALALLLDAEIGCKTTGRPAELICRASALEICRMAIAPC